MELILLPLFIGAVASVPIACFVVGAVFGRVGFHKAWTIALNILAGFAVLGGISMIGILGNTGTGTGAATAGFLVIFAASISVTVAATYLAVRRWPIDGPDA